MEKFTPKNKNSFAETIKKHLMEGDIIRYDFRDETPLEVMIREAVQKLPRMHNIGQEKEGVYKKIYCSHDILHEVVRELSKTYSIRDVRCAYSGCCQYSTYGYYIDGE